MFKYLIAGTLVACLAGCGSSATPPRPSDAHNYNLNHSIDRSLQVQECQDRFEECFISLAPHWQEACTANPEYCVLQTWGNAVFNSCLRREKVCESK